MTRAAETADFINSHPNLNMDQVCELMVQEGLFDTLALARDWFRYCVRQGHARGKITSLRRRRSKQQHQALAA